MYYLLSLNHYVSHSCYLTLHNLSFISYTTTLCECINTMCLSIPLILHIYDSRYHFQFCIINNKTSLTILVYVFWWQYVCIFVLAVTNRAAMSTRMLFGEHLYPGAELLSWNMFMFTSSEHFQSSMTSAKIYTFTTCAREFTCCTSFSTLVIISLF